MWQKVYLEIINLILWSKTWCKLKNYSFYYIEVQWRFAPLPLFSQIFFERTFYLLYIILLAKINIQSRKSIFTCFSCSNILRSFWVEGEWGKMIWHDHQEKGGSRVVQNMITGLEGTKIWLQDVSPVELRTSGDLVTLGEEGPPNTKIDHNTLNL